MIAASIVGDREMLDRLRALPEAARAGLGRAVSELARELERRVAEKLSGEVLQARSGSLRSSIEAAVDESATGIVVTVGSSLGYARAQEYSFAGTVGVRAHLRHITQAFGRPIAAKTIEVGASSRRMNLPERSFLRSALVEMHPQIEAAARRAMQEALGA